MGAARWSFKVVLRDRKGLKEVLSRNVYFLSRSVRRMRRNWRGSKQVSSGDLAEPLMTILKLVSSDMSPRDHAEAKQEEFNNN